MAGSRLMLASVVAFGVTQGTFSLTESGTSDNVWIFLGFAIAFAVKAPLFPFHGWLPLAYRESPVEVAAVRLHRFNRRGTGLHGTHGFPCSRLFGRHSLSFR